MIYLQKDDVLIRDMEKADIRSVCRTPKDESGGK